MRKISTIAALMTILIAPQVFADTDMSADSDSKACATIASACADAGYVRTESTDKRFWQDCMKPVLLGKTVSDITVESAVAKSCRADKIQQMKNFTKELQKVK